MARKVGDSKGDKKGHAGPGSVSDRYFSLYNISSDFVSLHDLNGNFIDANDAVLEFLGYRRDEIAGLSFTALLDGDQIPIVTQALQETKRLNRLNTSTDLRIRLKSGQAAYVSVNASAVLTGGTPVAIQVVARDVTATRLTENELHEVQAQYRLLSEHTTDGVLLLGMDLKIMYVSPSVKRMRGYTVEEAMTMPLEEQVTPESLKSALDLFVRELPRVQADPAYNPVHVLELEYYRKDGGTILMESKFSVIRGEGGMPVSILGESRDITDRRRLEEERQRLSKLESLGVLAGGIAHDFNNILTSVLGSISLARTKAPPGSQIRESLEQAEAATLRAKGLTGQLLAFSKGGAPVKKTTSLTELIMDTAGFALRGSNVRCSFSIPADLWHAEIDAEQVSQIIHNLVLNAEQSMPDGGTIELAAENRALHETRRMDSGMLLQEGRYILVTVTDHGSGIPVGHLDKIFDPFFTTKRKGSGLGLATSFTIARNHGGHLSVKSVLGQGSTFHLYLPASAEIAARRPGKDEEVKAAGKARILIMDDEEVVRNVAGDILKYIGYEDIEFAADGAQAINLYSSAAESGQPFSIVILDLTVPGGMGGMQTIKKLLELDPGARAIVSSGYADEAVMADYRKYGFRGVVAKPYSLEELGRAVIEVMDRG